MSKYHAGRGRKYELLACVSVIQREGCVRANEYRKYDLVACAHITLHEDTSASCWHVSASYRARTACV